MINGYLYLASPYTSSDKELQHARFVKVSKLGMEMIKRGLFISAPISQSVPMSIHGNFGGTWTDWQAQDLAMLRRSSGIVIYNMEGTAESVGVRAEYEEAISLNLPVFWLEDPYNATSLTALQNKVVKTLTWEDLAR